MKHRPPVPSLTLAVEAAGLNIHSVFLPFPVPHRLLPGKLWNRMCQDWRNIPPRHNEDVEYHNTEKELNKRYTAF